MAEFLVSLDYSQFAPQVKQAYSKNMNELQEEQAYTSLLKEARTQELDQRTLEAFNTVTLDLVEQEVITNEQRAYVWEILINRIEI